MEIIKNVPFYPNSSDNTHCFQAGLKMILKFFMPDKDFSFEELDKISMKKEGLWTWPMAALIWMQENGFDVVDIEIFDYRRFIDEGEMYLSEEFGEEVCAAQVKNSDIDQEREISMKFLEEIVIKKEIPKTEDIMELMRNGYIVAVNVNSKALSGKSGYDGHFIVIVGFDNDNFVIHDPGLPGVRNKKVPFEVFERAWAYPDERAKNITAFRMSENA